MPHSQTKIKGKDVPSVTEIVSILNKPFLAYWRGKIGNQEADRVMKESQEEGIKLHGMVENYLNCNSDESYNDVKRFKSWFDWYTKSGYSCEDTEVKVISYKYKFGGTLDAILKDGLEVFLTDWKFSNSDDHFRYLQLAGYAQAYYEQTGVKINKGLIVRVDKEAKAHIKEIDNLWKYVPLFIMCRKLWDFVNHKGKLKK